MDSRQFYQGFADMNQPLEPILGNMTAAMCILSALFMRFAWMVLPCNYVLLACYVSNDCATLATLTMGKGSGIRARGSARNNGFQTILSGQEAERGTMDSRQFWVCGHELTPGTDFGQHDSRALERLCVFLGICCLVEILILCLLLVLVAICIYSALFMRFVWMVQPRNYLLLACHLSNETVQLYQHSRCSKRQGFQGAGQGTMDSRQSYQQCVSTQCCSLDLHGWYSLTAIYFWHAIPRIRPCYSINSHDGIQAKWLGKEQRFQYNLIRLKKETINN